MPGSSNSSKGTNSFYPRFSQAEPNLSPTAGMVDRDIEAVLPSKEPDGTTPLLNHGGVAENERQMPSHSTVEVDDRLTLRVRMSSDDRTFSVPTRMSSSIQSLKADIVRVIDGKGKDIRLIASGKILKPDSKLVGNFKIADQSFVHCVVNNASPRNESCSVQSMEEEVSGNDDEVNAAAANTDPSHWRGFDRLRTFMSSEQIVAVRGYFAPQVLQMASSTGETGNTDEEEGGMSAWDRQIEAEERWMATQGESSEFAINTAMRQNENTLRRSSVHDLELGDLQEVVTYGLAESIRDFFIGLMLGFFLRNVVAFFFCLTEDSVRPRFKLGIVCGIALNVAHSLMTDMAKEEGV